MLKKFEDQAQVLKHTNGELSKAKQLASSQGTGTDSSGMAKETEKLRLKNAVIGLSLQLFDDIEKVKNRVISDLGDIEANNSLELSDQIERYKQLKAQYEKETSTSFTLPKDNSKGKSSHEFLEKIDNLLLSNISSVDYVDQTDLAKSFNEVVEEYKDLATKAIAKCKFEAQSPSQRHYLQ